MGDWYLAPSLATGRAEVNARWPNRDRTSDGTIGNEEHQQRQSDHNPNSRDSVNAWDVDVNGVHIPTILDAFERHPGAHYWIYNRQIADRDNDWRPVQYGGDNPHTGHAHLSIRQASWAEQDRRPWGIFPVEEEDLKSDERKWLSDLHFMFTSIKPTGEDGNTHGGVALERLLDGQAFISNGLTRHHAEVMQRLNGIGAIDPTAFANALAASPQALEALTAAMRDQLPLIPTAQEVAKAVLVWISAGVHNGTTP